MRNLILLVLGLFAAAIVNAQNPSLSFVVSSQTCSENIDSFQIAVTISTPSPNPTSVDINVVGGNAVFGTNFTYGPVTVTFPANTPYTQLFTVYVIDDSIPDGTKSVTFGLANPTNSATIGAISQCTLIMMDADTPKISYTQFIQPQNENIGTVNVPIALNRGVRDTTKVQLNLIPSGTTAVNGVDFVFNNTTIIWPPDSDGVIYAHIPIINNPFYEPQRTVELTLTNPTNGAILTDTTYTLTILANSADTTQGCSDLFLGQYIQGSGNNQALQIFNPTAVPIDMSVYSILISANGGSTTTAFNLSGTIQPRGIYVVSNPNAVTAITSLANATPAGFIFDGTEAVALLHNADTIDVIGQLHTYPGSSGWTVGNGSTQAHTLIRNFYDYLGDTSWTSAVLTWDVYPQDMVDSLGFHHADSCGSGGPVATVTYGVSSDSINQVDTTIWIYVMVNNPTADTLYFSAVADAVQSTAIEGYSYDYVFTNRNYASPPGITVDSFYILISPRPEITPTKKLLLKFIDLPSNLIATPDSTMTIYLLNHNKFIVSFLGAGYSYPKGVGSVEIPVVLSTYSSQPTTVDISLSSGSAILGQDFLFNDTTITFPAFSLDTQGVWVDVLNNNVYEANKQANFNLSNATNNAILGITAFTLTIVNNDSLAGGISEATIDDGIKVFPNPVLSNLMVQTSKNLQTVEISDVLGNRINNLGNLPAGTNSIDVTSLQPGVYFLNMKTTEGFYCQRFIKIE